MNQHVNHEAGVNAGIPYDDINWYDITGQPFGTAINFNAIVFGDGNNIVDTKGAMAVGGNFSSSRGLSLGFGNNTKLEGTGYSPDLVRFLVGKNVAMKGPLVVAGHVVVGGEFQAANGSTYMIGKDGSNDQVQRLTQLYYAENGSRYWSVSERDTHYVISSYDVPRYIPARRIQADTQGFFENARDSIRRFHHCITGLLPNGTVTDHYHEWILRGQDPVQNIFVIDVRPNGLLKKEIRFEIPEGSLGIVILRTGPDAHLQYGLWGRQESANRTLYVFEDAKHIYMEVPAAIWGSILAPDAMFHAHQTGGTVTGNAALGELAVNASSGFEFHLMPFIGGVICAQQAQMPASPVPTPQPVPPPAPMPIPRPAPQPTPLPAPAQEQRPTPPPAARPVPQPAPMPVQRPTPAPSVRPAPQPTPMPVPQPAPNPVQRPAPAVRPTPPPAPIPVPQPAPRVVPQPTPQPSCPPCPACKEAAPCPECKEAPPCPVCEEAPPCPTCPTCPACPEQETRIIIEPVPIPIPVTVEEPECPAVCLVEPGVIFGCIWGCSCCDQHDWEALLYTVCKDGKKLLYREKLSCCGCFEFRVPYDDYYLLCICPLGAGAKGTGCKPVLTLKNVGVISLMID